MTGICFRIILIIDRYFFYAKMYPIFTLYMKGTGFPPVIDVIIVPVHFDVSRKKKM